MISAAHPETLRRSTVSQVLYWNRVTLPTSAIRSRQPGRKPGGQRISFPPKLLVVTGLAPATVGFRALRGTGLSQPTSEPGHSPVDFSRQLGSAEGC